METMYKGYWITFNFYGREEYTVQYCGDDIVFDTAEEAKEFINKIESEEEV